MAHIVVYSASGMGQEVAEVVAARGHLMHLNYDTMISPDARISSFVCSTDQGAVPDRVRVWAEGIPGREHASARPDRRDEPGWPLVPMARSRRAARWLPAAGDRTCRPRSLARRRSAGSRIRPGQSTSGWMSGACEPGASVSICRSCGARRPR